MTAHLLLLTIGPVQDFIAQARRTRDLWYGSHLLSELGRAAARALAEGGARLIFPTLTLGDPELVACAGPLRPDETPPLSIANRLLVEIPADRDPESIARTTRAAVKTYWRDQIAARVQRDRKALIDRDTEAAWDEQIDTLLEVFACWAPLGDHPEAYQAARRAVDRTLAARTNLRDFSQWQHLRGGVPKSSLDGGRETVLPVEARDRHPPTIRKYRITEHEQLDAVGLVKRAGGEPDQFVPIINVALAPWVALADRTAATQLRDLRAACAELGIKRVRPLPCTQPFPFDATILLPSRWRSVFKELGLGEHTDPAVWGPANAGPVLRELAEPFPYVACLVADGDHMGRAIERLDSAAAHRDFSGALARFAGDAREIVEQRHLGSLVYAGGDDVLAFVPLPEALACAEALRQAFTGAMTDACPGLGDAARPTLSVGLGIGHIMESMGELLAIGRSAEIVAKGGTLPAADQRNALAIVVDKRSGGRRIWRSRWTDLGGDPATRLQKDAELLAGPLSSRKVYEIDSTLARLPRPGAASDPAWAKLLALEVGRSLARAHTGEQQLDLETIGLTLDEHAGYAAVHGAVSAWIDRMLVARTFADARPRSSRPDPGAPQ